MIGKRSKMTMRPLKRGDVCWMNHQKWPTNLRCEGKDEGPVFKLLKENNERRGKGWLALAFKESDGSKDPGCIKRIVGMDASALLCVFHLSRCSRCQFFFFDQGALRVVCRKGRKERESGKRCHPTLWAKVLALTQSWQRREISDRLFARSELLEKRRTEQAQRRAKEKSQSFQSAVTRRCW